MSLGRDFGMQNFTSEFPEKKVLYTMFLFHENVNVPAYVFYTALQYLHCFDESTQLKWQSLQQNLNKNFY